MFDIDLVYLWVDGSDPKWQKKKQRVTGKLYDTSEVNNAGRYISNDELKYSLRSVEKNAPWIHKIYIITDNQCPNWLNTEHTLIQIIDHKEIIPEEVLPTFNSSVIEYFIHKVPNLKEHFLIGNDDTFFNKELEPSYFFKNDGLPIVRFKKKFFGRYHYTIKKFIRGYLGQYISMVVTGAKLVEEKFGVFYSGIPHHNIDAYKKSDYKYAAEHVFYEQVDKSKNSRLRVEGDLHRSAFSYYALAAGKAHLKYVSRRESSRINVSSKNFIGYINKYQPDLFCLNDSQRTKDIDRMRIKPFLKCLFPKKSSFEL